MDRAQGPRPSSASVQVRELSWHGRHNPHPQSKDPGSHGSGRSEHLVEEYLSPARLRALAQMPDLRLVSTLEMCVDTREYSLGNFGLHLPSLSQLKLNGSRLGSVRDLGTSLGRLQVLWLTRCGLEDLDGIGFFPALKELYASYNCISDLSPLCLLEQLEMLDLEGNGVEDLGQVCYLQLCPRLATLTLEGNLVCLRPGPHNKVPLGYNYRAEVRRLIPQIQVLDDVPATLTSPPASRKLDQDWLMVKAAIQEGRVLNGLLPTLDRPHGDHIWRLSPELSLPETQPRAPRPWPLALLVPRGPLPEDLLPKDQAPGDDASNLTHGAGPVLCGNPTKGLRERRHQCQAWEPTEQLPSQRLEGLATNACPPGPDPADSHDVLALAGLEAWRGLRLRQLESWQEGAKVPRGPRRGPEAQEDETGPKTSPSPLNLAPELSRTLGYHLLPSPPKLPMPPDSSSPWGSTDLQFRGRRLRALGDSGPGLDQGLAAVAALRSLEGASGPSPRNQGCPGPKPAPNPAAGRPALRCLPHLNPVTPAQSHP
ncbi:leucine-rich repeat-containing protein 56 isoform X1 [Rhinolophus ferrumequinum]|uniref:Leucine rich repeat containing 56 n=1 Tax=Rhinolophus ferrumequinum TaxID=59479 RepID=A0A671DZV2_RHIFE|nr:leucine-rich repeat-containing protein 56 isoform X1 [Rhinolophus ferrumequinum]XP_032977414.1 leucine-rich repeat-containing protein 56 isoform X1 [Rhinolophus ferrumequinum]XP_032977415.1 leucine-rich repeat-containing protein 56 isoform X1 [Rhinolophus ferrumequinum]XP_032977416.1 leucine-rich repeat-containing protein 56 isoform X1 [Rhinolophus ferrumequinum]XP_032977417.1 leucine-rich repeat-containing protein 56 isoform X1 [Rhinolophus ferrumequinum]